ncbi:MAG TPA: 4-(cytidine 5'-diphospho)-2-C-methyl-D-erythritol kinase [Thermodesulfovibrionales bacterium]|nr:4-(cytidine 5'-diphospho)-2-C-methyl-D-erythritol kinase [Thermodesulfovibrionales bacterium]
MFALNAPAKINWFLNVLDKREDGYHDIVSLLQCVSLSDFLIMENSSAVEVTTGADIPRDDNLVYKAATLMREKAGIASGVKITLHKEIPLAAGLGGGSSDAAATLMGLNKLWDLDFSSRDLARLGETLGSDVPFFFHGPASVVEGRGEIVSPVELRKSYSLLLVKPKISISAAWTYAEYDQVSSSREVLTKRPADIKLFCQALERGDFELLSSLQGNNLEPFVVRRYPVIGEIKRGLKARGALFSSMSGSGSSVFGVFGSERDAENAREYMAPHWCRVVKTVRSDA